MQRRKKKINTYSIVKKPHGILGNNVTTHLVTKPTGSQQNVIEGKEKPRVRRIRTEGTTKPSLETIHGPRPACIGFGQVGLIWRAGHHSGSPRDRLESKSDGWRAVQS